MFCCEIFSSFVENIGKRGFSIVPGSKMNLRSFFLQSRTHDELKTISPGSETLTETVNNSARSSVIQQAIKFCPFCGTNLDRWIKKNKSTFDRLALDFQNCLLD